MKLKVKMPAIEFDESTEKLVNMMFGGGFTSDNLKERESIIDTSCIERIDAPVKVSNNLIAFRVHFKSGKDMDLLSECYERLMNVWMKDE